MSWDYNKVNGELWNTKPLEEQEAILKKYYPIGDTFHYKPSNESNISPKCYVSIIGYEIRRSKMYNLVFYTIIISKQNDIGEYQRTHPAYLEPLLRNINLEKLGI